MEIKIIETIKNDFAVSTENGDIIFNAIDQAFSKHEMVTINFIGVKSITTAFLNAAIGQLYSKDRYTSEFLNKNLKLSGYNNNQFGLIKIVISRAKEYFEDKIKFEKNLKDSFNGDN